jgi:protein TonB
MQLSSQGESVGPMRFYNAPGLLLAFVALSTLVHGVSLISYNDRISPPEQSYGTTIISTVLAPVEKSAPLTPVKNTIHQPQAESVAHSIDRTITTKKSKTITNTENKIKPTYTQPLHTLPSTAKPELANLSATTEKTRPHASNETLAMQKQRNYLLGKLQHRLSHYLTYPQRARRRGWQGQVMVAFHINTFGKLNNVRLAQSSGYSLLDRSALVAIGKLGHITLPDRLGPLQAMELLLPVHYQLHEG